MFGLNEDQSIRLLYLVLLLALIVGSAGFGWGRMRTNLRHLLVWALIAVGLIVVYAYRAPLQRFVAPVLQELDPSRVVEVTSADGTVELAIARGRDGHFHVDAEADGTPVRFLVDTGASTTVLTLNDAARIGIDVDALRFNRPVQTANGTAFFARAVISNLDVGPFRLASVDVGIMPAGSLNTNLLGMNTIDRFSGWRVEGNRMVLTP